MSRLEQMSEHSTGTKASCSSRRRSHRTATLEPVEESEGLLHDEAELAQAPGCRIKPLKAYCSSFC